MEFLQKVDIQSNLEKEDSKEEWSIWVIDEENIERSIEYYSAFKKDPQDSKYDAPKKKLLQISQKIIILQRKIVLRTITFRKNGKTKTEEQGRYHWH